MRISTPSALLEDEVKDIYDFEKRLVRAIPKMAKAATSDELRSGLLEHLEVTKNHVERIEQVFELLGVPAKAKACEGMKGIIAEGDETVGEVDDPVRDVAIAAAARRVEHYEMAAYAGAKAIAEQLGENDVADLLQQSFDEEQEADEKLAQLAEKFLQSTATDSEENSDRSSRRSAGTPRTRRAAE